MTYNTTFVDFPFTGQDLAEERFFREWSHTLLIIPLEVFGSSSL